MQRQDRLASDVDRGFTALENGEIEEAEAVLERCSRIDRKHADVVALAAAIADARGDGEAALAKYSELSELRPDDPMPRICMARLQLHDLGDPDAALDTLDATFDFIDEEADLIEAIVVRAEALLAAEDPESARGALAELSSSVIDDPELAFDLAELSLAAEDPRAALRWVEIARKDETLATDALHLLGRIHEARGDRAAMIEAWQEVRDADLAAPAGPVSISEDELERIASEALHELPATARARLEHVPILIDDIPAREMVADGFDPRTLGVIEGSTLADTNEQPTTATHIRLFRRNLERIAHDLDELAEEVRITVLHETAHYFGLEDEDLERIGLD
ncbi:MAG TPA: metallopeptidase family protein [Kofleriaceae bacterium]|nr:metallopeptidase family protein [Kofleriaceae bacterium]